MVYVCFLIGNCLGVIGLSLATTIHLKEYQVRKLSGWNQSTFEKNLDEIRRYTPWVNSPVKLGYPFYYHLPRGQNF